MNRSSSQSVSPSSPAHLSETVEDRLELLDDGQHLAFTDVVQGPGGLRWQYTLPAASLGTHRLTARYKGKESAAWVFTVARPQVDVENFFGYPQEAFKTKTFRNFYIEVTNRDLPYTGVSTRANLLTMQTQEAGPFSIPLIFVKMVFNKVYSTVELGCAVALSGGATSGVSRIEALDSSGNTLELLDVSRSTVPLPVYTLGVPQEKRIKALRFTNVYEGPPGGAHNMFLHGDVIMTE